MDHLYLYVALIGVVLVLFALTRNGKRVPPSTDVASTATASLAQATLERELHATLETFMNELERENAHLLQTLSQLQQESQQQFTQQQDMFRALEQRVEHLESRLEEQALLLETETAEISAQSPEPEVEEPSKPAFAFNEKYARVVELSRQGQTAEQIARETGIGLGEIHFVLGLAKREDV